MQVNLQKLSPVLVELDVLISAERVHAELDKAYGRVMQNAKIRGFRPGKAPRNVIAQVYGPSIAADVTQRLVEETFGNAVSQSALQPLGEPAFEPQRLVDNQPFGYKARFEIVPQLDAVNYDGLEATRPNAKATDAQVEERLEALRREHSTLEPLKEARAAAEGDVATIDFTVVVDGEEIPEASAQGFQVELGAGTLIQAIDAALRGKNVGDATEAVVTMSPNHQVPRLRGKDATFKLLVKDLKERVLPVADDEFAKDLGEFASLEELKTKLREELEKEFKDQSDTKLAEQLVMALVQANDVPVPSVLVQQQAAMTEQEILQKARSQGNDARNLGEELRGKILLDSEIKVKAGLLMAEIAKREGIRIGDAELEKGLEELAAQTGKNVAKLRAEYREPRKRELLIGMILENKVLDILESKAKITDETVG